MSPSHHASRALVAILVSEAWNPLSYRLDVQQSPRMIVHCRVHFAQAHQLVAGFHYFCDLHARPGRNVLCVETLVGLW